MFLLIILLSTEVLYKEMYCFQIQQVFKIDKQKLSSSFQFQNCHCLSPGCGSVAWLQAVGSMQVLLRIQGSQRIHFYM